MRLLFDSFWRAFAYCLHPRVIGLSLLPLLVVGVVMLGVSYLFWEPALAAVHTAFDGWAPMHWLLGGMAQLLGEGFRAVFEQIVLVLLAIPVVVAFVLVLVGLWSTPAAVAMVSARRFPLLERRHGGAWWKGLLWSMLWTLVALLAVIVTLPLWLIPGMALVLPPLIWGWLTAHVMGFDALAEHATASERQGILRAHRWPLLLMGVLTGFLCSVPSLVWTLSPMMLIWAPFIMVPTIWIYTMILTFAALWFSHYALFALSQLRAAESAMTASRPDPGRWHELPLVEEVPRVGPDAAPGPHAFDPPPGEGT